MKPKFRLLILLATVVLGSWHSTQAAEFTQTQRSEIEGILRDYLLKNPEVLLDAMKALEQRQGENVAKQQQEQIEKQKSEIYHSDDDFVGGNPKGDIALVEFFDYNCGFCQRSLPDVKKLITTDKGLRVIFKEFPILGPGSTFAAKAAIAAMKQDKYLQMHEALYEHRGTKDEAAVLSVAGKVGLNVDRLKRDMADPKIQMVIDQNAKLAAALKIDGTPGFLIDRRVIQGAVGFDALAAEIATTRKAGGCQVC
jgi:protein-disulfide isomerase